MGKVVEKGSRSVVDLTTQDMNELLIEPAKANGWIDFDPTRVNVSETPAGFTIIFERVEARNRP